MLVGLIDVDSHNFPNLALMKISGWHKAQGDEVEWWHALTHYDRVYVSKVFDDTYTPDMQTFIDSDEVIRGGTGYGLENKLPDDIEHAFPDYSLYPKLTKNTAYGFLTRGCPWNCGFCLVTQKEGCKSVKVADLSEWWNGQKNIVLLDPNTLACKEHMDLLKQLSDSNAWVDFTQGLDAKLLTEENITALNQVKVKMIHFAWDLMERSEMVLRGLNLYLKHGAVKELKKRAVYVLTNYNTTMEENLYRIYTLRDMGFDPYVMIYDKPNAQDVVKKLQRWVNGKEIFRVCARFEDYNPKVRCNNA